MDIKWKNKLILAAWFLLLTFGLSGITLGLSEGHTYVKGDYFQTPEFQGQLEQFINYLTVFELDNMPKEDAIKAITVTKEEIEEHRYRYGELTEQVANITQQYEPKIQNALSSNNKEAADFYTTERDKKIDDITNNFRSDEYVKVKVIKEKEEKLDAYYREMENHRSEFMKYKGAFRYNLKETTTGAVYSNLETPDGGDGNQPVSNKELIYIQRYPSSTTGPILLEGRASFINGETEPGRLINKKAKVFEGYIAVPKSAIAENSLLADYYNFQQKQKIFFVYVLGGILAFILSLYTYKKASVMQLITIGKYQPIHNRIPVDISLLGLAFTGFIALILISDNWPLYLHEHLYSFIERLVSDLITAAIFVALTFIQGKFLLERLNDRQNHKVIWQKSMLYRAYNGVQEAFLNRSIGIQTLILLGIVFSSGMGLGLAAVEPRIFLVFIPVVMAVVIPTIIVIMRRIGYFNLIVNNVGELVRGNFELDLPVKGKSVLANLAENINTLKHGVKASQREQVKSERLKTELITNVSHDLRTPLTSIITYTELLKTPDLTNEDRDAYIEIIDRKSKRLKVLIDDLFEASKMASGNIELVKEKVDLVQLLQQALAEHNETISQSTLQFRITNPDTSVYAFVDGQKLWRVFDNLIGNILKYSLENTRVFISIKALQGKAVISFKNIAKYELGENIDELFERFKRGDTSRHTEGSGLGLAIAKSIVDLHGGSLEIGIDGDLFKITITLNAMQ